MSPRLSRTEERSKLRRYQWTVAQPRFGTSSNRYSFLLKVRFVCPIQASGGDDTGERSTQVGTHLGARRRSPALRPERHLTICPQHRRLASRKLSIGLII